jgi:hypothetical protein
MTKINHLRLFSHALRTALLFVAGFLIYEILIRLEKMWNVKYPENRLYNLYQRKTYKLMLIFIIDLLIPYGIVVFFGIHH